MTRRGRVLEFIHWPLSAFGRPCVSESTEAVSRSDGRGMRAAVCGAGRDESLAGVGLCCTTAGVCHHDAADSVHCASHTPRGPAARASVPPVHPRATSNKANG